METQAAKPLTAEEFYRLPPPADGSRQELVRGVIETMPPPRTYHGVCCARLARRLGNLIEDQRLGHLASNDSGFVTDLLTGEDVLPEFECRVAELFP